MDEAFFYQTDSYFDRLHSALIGFGFFNDFDNSVTYCLQACITSIRTYTYNLEKCVSVKYMQTKPAMRAFLVSE